MAFELRNYQIAITEKARELMRSGCKSILITSPTGSGKTVLTANMLNSASQKGMDSMFMVHRRELIKQSTATFSAVGVRHGIIAAKFPVDSSPHVQIASIQTMVNRIGKIRAPKLFIWDECHHIAAAGWEKIFRSFPQSFHIGLTATPERLDGKGLGKYFSEMIRGPEVEWLISDGFLCQYKALCPPGVSMDGVHTRMGDFVQSEVSAVVDKPQIVGDSVKLYFKHAYKKRTVVFAISVEHSMHLVYAFKAAGIRAAHVDGETESAERDLKIEMFKNGELDILSNVGLFGEGFDVPAIECVMDVAPTMSLGAYLQRFGRALRPVYARGMPLETAEDRLGAIKAGGKPFALYLDQAGNLARHGLPDEIREWSLDGRVKGKKQSSEVTIKICKNCYAAVKSIFQDCPVCGHSFPVSVRTVEQIDGDLVEVDLEALRKKRKIEQGTADTEEKLIALGKARGYKRPELWARHLMIARKRK